MTAFGLITISYHTLCMRAAALVRLRTYIGPYKTMPVTYVITSKTAPWLAHFYHNERIVVKTRVDNTIEFMAINDREIVIFV